MPERVTTKLKIKELTPCWTPISLAPFPILLNIRGLMMYAFGGKLTAKNLQML
jgi:hypothetical protein